MSAPTIESQKKTKAKSDAKPEAAEQESKHENGHETHELKDRAKAATEKVTAQADHAWKWTRGAVRKPSVGAGIAGAAVLGVGAIWGVTEALVAGAAGWVIYKTLKRRRRKRSAQGVPGWEAV